MRRRSVGSGLHSLRVVSSRSPRQVSREFALRGEQTHRTPAEPATGSGVSSSHHQSEHSGALRGRQGPPQAVCGHSAVSCRFELTGEHPSWLVLGWTLTGQQAQRTPSASGHVRTGGVWTWCFLSQGLCCVFSVVAQFPHLPRRCLDQLILQAHLPLSISPLERSCAGRSALACGPPGPLSLPQPGAEGREPGRGFVWLGDARFTLSTGAAVGAAGGPAPSMEVEAACSGRSQRARAQVSASPLSRSAASQASCPQLSTGKVTMAPPFGRRVLEQHPGRSSHS